MGKIKDGKFFYHLTKLSNLDSIISNGLLPRRLLETNKYCFEDVADSKIMDKRRLFDLDQYIPFHFHPYSSFDIAVKNTYESEEFIYLCITRELAKENKFLILPKHPLSIEEVEILDYDCGMEAIDWNAMELSSTTSSYNKNVRMAECLTKEILPINYITSIGVKNDSIKRFVEEKLKNIKGNKPHVNVRVWLN